jgi:hypothetical protein
MSLQCMWATCELLVKCCNIWCVMLNHVWPWFVCWLVQNSSWFRWTTGVIWVQVWQFDHFDDCFCTCALIMWVVPLHRIIHTIYWISSTRVWYYNINELLQLDNNINKFVQLTNTLNSTTQTTISLYDLNYYNN